MISLYLYEGNPESPSFKPKTDERSFNGRLQKSTFREFIRTHWTALTEGSLDHLAPYLQYKADRCSQLYAPTTYQPASYVIYTIIKTRKMTGFLRTAAIVTCNSIAKRYTQYHFRFLKALPDQFIPKFIIMLHTDKIYCLHNLNAFLSI